MSLFTKNHEWITFNPSKNEAFLGMTPFLLDELGKIMFLEYQVQPKDIVNKNEVIIKIESIKIVFEITMFVKSKILDINQEIEKNLDLFSEKDWLIKFSILEESPLTFLKTHLMDKNRYHLYLKEVNNI